MYKRGEIDNIYDILTENNRGNRKGDFVHVFVR